MNLRMLAMCVAVLTLTGCTRRTVYVVDEAGNPVPGAKVTLVTLSMNLEQGRTSSKGRVDTDAPIQQALDLTASADGFLTGRIPYPDGWPATIQLRRGVEQPVTLKDLQLDPATLTEEKGKAKEEKDP